MKSDVMRCEECSGLLEDYFDHSLDQRRATAVALHLETCAECTSRYEVIGLEDQVYRRYEREITVGPQLWAAIEARISEDVQIKQIRSNLGRVQAWFGRLGSFRLSPALAAAMVIIAIGLTVVVTSYFEQKQPTNLQPQESASAGQQPTASPVSPGAGQGTPTVPDVGGPAKNDDGPAVPVKTAPPRNLVARKPTPQQLIREAEQKYLSAIAILSRDANRRKSTMDPVSLARFESALAVIDNTIDETRRAARKSPDDPIALQYLLASYSKKVDVLREMARE
jgi:hypothetical protein